MMHSTKTLIVLPFFAALQVLSVNAEGFADIELRDVVLPRSPVGGALIGDAVDVLTEKRAIEARAAPDACTIVLGAISFCSSVSPGFLTFAPSRQAPCLCYSSTSWVASLFDGYIASCASYAKTADPADYSALSALGGFCSSVGNVRPASLSASATLSSTPSTTRAGSSSSASGAASSGTARSTTASSTITSRPATTTGTGIGGANAGCATVSKLLNSCVTATRGFTDIAVKSQAACLCYSSASWVPNSFDNGVQTCAEYVKTADPSDYSVISALGGFCTAAGDVLAASATSVRTGSTVVLTGGGVSAATNLGNGNTVPLVITGVAPPTNTPAQTGPVTVTAPGPSPTKSSGAGNLNMWDSMLLGIASVAIPAIIFL